MSSKRSGREHILIVDDVPANLRLLVDALEEHGYAVAVAQDGHEALARAEYLRPDLILLDVMMPEMDGFEAARRLKAGELTAEIPIVFMTALSEVDDKLIGFAAGGVDYVTKPFEVAEVIARVDTQVNLRLVQRQAQDINLRLQLEVQAHRRLQSEYRDSEQRYRTLVEMLPLAVLVHLNERVAFANGAACRLLGSKEGELLEQLTLARVPAAHHEDFKLRLRQAGDGKRELLPLAMQMLRTDGSTVDVEVSGAAISYGSASAIMLVMRDTTEQREYESALRHQANHDLLTGLPNRTLLLDRLRLAISRSRRYDERLGVMFIDLDKFKYINDTLGHSAGDDLLCTIARRLAACVRECDTVARLGGDEFILLVDGVNDTATLAALAQRTVPAISTPLELAGQSHSVTCSIGISVYPQDGEEPEELLKRADIAMYRAKETGRNNFQFFTPQMQARMEDHVRLENQLHHALQRDEFVLHFQPQVSLRDGSVVGMEALIRWHSPEFGLLSPARFIPFAEESDLILSIGEWVLHEACRQIKAWQDAGLDTVPISINVSASQFARSGLEQEVSKALQAHHLAANLLELELTEIVSMRDPENSILWLHRLKEVGVSLSIDDFGTGYSNLAYLKRFPVNKIKIDQSFVRGLTSDPQDFAITTAVIRMARSLGLRAVAEGVETEGQMRLLVAESCDEFQGFYFSKPLPAAEAAVVLREQPTIDLGGLRRGPYRRTMLIIDDDEMVRQLFMQVMPDDVNVLAAASCAEAYEVLANNEVGVIVSDQHLPGEDGVSFFSRIKKMYPRSVRMLLTADDGSGILMDAINRGEIYRFIVKPWEPSHVVRLVLEALERYEH